MDGQLVSVASWSSNREVTLAHAGCSEFQGGGDVFGFEIGIIRKQFLTGLPGCELAENRGDGDTQISDAGHAAHSIRVNRDAIEVHDSDRTCTLAAARPSGLGAMYASL